jgi:hypothetical protein
MTYVNISNNSANSWSRQPAEVTYVLHDPNSFFGMRHKLIFRLLDFLLGFRTQLWLFVLCGAWRSRRGQFPSSPSGPGLDGIQRQSSLLDILSRTRSKHQVRVEGCVPTSQEAALDLGILGQTCLADSLGSQSVLLKSGRKGILACPRVLLVEGLAAS